MMTILQIVLTAIALFLIAGTLLNLSKHPHWFIRAWDFPRVFLAAFSAAIAIVYGTLFNDSAWEIALVLGLTFVVVRQCYMIYPYIPIAIKTVKRSTRAAGDHQFRLLISNVLMENEEYEKWLQVIRDADPDVIVAVEVDEKWLNAIAPLEEDYPHSVKYPLENYYGMVLLSRLEFDGEPEIKFLVQDDIPSIHGIIKLRDGQHVSLHALHPRPPEPIYQQDSAPRDAELVLMGNDIAKYERRVPTIVCGDLNDVAWSFTTQLFLRLSKLLDPRMGRGFYNSFNAKSRLFRYPLDHVFHSDELQLVELRVLEYVGSDHFPVLIHLSCEPQSTAEQEEPEAQEGDQEAAEELVEEQAEREDEGKEEGHVAQEKPNV